MTETKRIDNAHIIETMAGSTFETTKLMDKTTVVACKLPSGFVIVESSSCIDPANYDEKLGIQICMERIKSRLYELEGYKAHTKE